MIVIDHSKKTFMKIAKADLDAMMKQLEDTMAELPPEMRQMMAGRMGGGAASAIVWRRQGSRQPSPAKPARSTTCRWAASGRRVVSRRPRGH